MDYSKIIEIVKKRLQRAHDPSKEHVRKEFFQKEYKFFKSHIKNKKVLVAGSGLGHDSIEIAKNNKWVIGIEIIKEYTEIARKKIKEMGIKNVHFEHGNFRKLNYPNKTFDVAVLNMGTIGDFKDKENILKELLRVSKKVFFDFYPPTKKGLNKRKKMYEEENWENVRIKGGALISDDGLYSKSIPKGEIKRIAQKLKSKLKFYDFCDFSSMVEITQN